MNFLAQNIHYLIKEKALNIQDFEKQTSVSITEIESPVLQIKQVLKISAFFNVSVDKLLKQNLAKEKKRNSNIKMLILDVDGVLTDGGVGYSESGHDSKIFNVRDGMGIIQLRKKGFPVGIISSSLKSNHVKRRMEDLGVEHCYIGKKQKIDVIKNWCKELQFKAENIAYIGDDLNDIDVLNFVGFSACPNDAIEEVQSLCDIVLNAKGGKACVREFIDTYIGISFNGF